MPPGDYRLTLYCVDDEALQRMGRTWNGPQEVVVLTAGGGPDDAANEILPFTLRRDTSWVGRYSIAGNTLTGLAWFDDSWDIFTLNIDRQAVQELGIETGSCLRTVVPDVGITLVSVYAPSWNEARDLEPPAGVPLDEYGFATLLVFQTWDGTEALFCRRDRTTTAIGEPHKHIWLPATVEVLSVRAMPPERVRGPLLLDAGVRAYWRADLRERHYFGDLQFLIARLMGRVEGLPWGEPIPLPRAIQYVDAAMSPLGLTPFGDFSFDVSSPRGLLEYTNRLYGGLPDIFAAIWGSRDTFEVFFFSRMADGTWALTGTVTPRVAEMVSARKGLSMRAGTGRFDKVLAAHRAHVAESGETTLPAPKDLNEGVAIYDAYLKAAID